MARKFLSYDEDLSKNVKLQPADSEALQTLTVPIPDCEAQRLQIVHQSGLLYSNTQDADFDRLSALTARVLHAPICLITFMDTTVSFIKSQILPGNATGPSTAPRNDVFCAFTILPESPDVLVILDGSQDHRVRNRGCVKDGFLFYAGAPIMLDNVKIGTLCILDPQPKTQFTMEERTNLLDLAASVSILVKKSRDYNVGLAKERSRMLLDLSHNLRTPLTSLELIVKNLKNDHDTSLPNDSDKSSSANSNSESTKQKRLNQKTQTIYNIDEAEIAVRQLNMIVENSLSAVRAVLCSEAGERNTDEICVLISIIKNIQFIASSLDGTDKKFIWNYKKLESYFEHSEQQTYPEVLKFAIISLLRQLYTNWEQITIDFDYIYNTSQNIETDSIIDGSLSVCIGVSSVLSARQYSQTSTNNNNKINNGYMTTTNITSGTDSRTNSSRINATTLFPSNKLNSSSDWLNSSSDMVKRPPSSSSYESNNMTRNQLNSHSNNTYTLNSARKFLVPTSNMSNDIPKLEFSAVAQSVREISGAFDIVVSDPHMNHGSIMEFHIWIPCRLRREISLSSSRNHTIDINYMINGGSGGNNNNNNHPHTLNMSQLDSHQDQNSHLSTFDGHNSYMYTKSHRIVTSRPPNVLLVEDSIPVQKAMSRYLTKAGCHVTCASNGRLGLHELQTESYDMVLCDFLMPVKSGMELFQDRRVWIEEQKQLKETEINTNNTTTNNNNTSNTLILNEHTLMIGMSATASPIECGDCFDAGMHFFVAKPISAEIMTILVEAAKINIVDITHMNITNSLKEVEEEEREREEKEEKEEREEVYCKQHNHNHSSTNSHYDSPLDSPVKSKNSRFMFSLSYKNIYHEYLDHAIYHIRNSTHCKEYATNEQMGAHKYGVILSRPTSMRPIQGVNVTTTGIVSNVPSAITIPNTDISRPSEYDSEIPEISSPMSTYHTPPPNISNSNLISTIDSRDSIDIRTSNLSSNDIDNKISTSIEDEIHIEHTRKTNTTSHKSITESMKAVVRRRSMNNKILPSS